MPAENFIDPPAHPARDNRWLDERLRLIVANHFSNVPQGYPIVIRFGSRARCRFGSIAARGGKTVILINALFAAAEVPDYVIDSTIAHEMAHYAHGFGSGLPRVHADPHRGGVIDRELEARGLMEATRRSEEWRKLHWEPLYARHCSDLAGRRDARERAAGSAWEALWQSEGARTIDDLEAGLRRACARIGTADCHVHAVGWLAASLRQSGASYWYPRTSTLRLHGLLADRRVPDAMVEFELAYWVARRRVGSSWNAIQQELKRCGYGEVMAGALKWRRSRWTQFRRRNHPGT